MELTTRLVLNKFLADASTAVEKAKKFSSLNYEQLNWRPAENTWSVAECFEHLIRTNAKYIPVFQKNASDSDNNKVVTFNHTLMGKLILKSVTPDVKKKYKTGTYFNPIGSTIGENIVNEYLNLHYKMIELVKNLDHSKFKEKVTSPFAKFVRYNIGDSLLIIANHDLRHLNQAERVIQNGKFPF